MFRKGVGPLGVHRELEFQCCFSPHHRLFTFCFCFPSDRVESWKSTLANRSLGVEGPQSCRASEGFVGRRAGRHPGFQFKLSAPTPPLQKGGLRLRGGPWLSGDATAGTRSSQGQNPSPGSFLRMYQLSHMPDSSREARWGHLDSPCFVRETEVQRWGDSWVFRSPLCLLLAVIELSE